MRRGVLLAALLAALLVLAACTSDGGSEDAGGETPTSIEEETTTSTAAPILYGLVPNLALAPQQCWADLPETTTSTSAATTTTSSADGATTTTTEVTVPETLPPTATTIPQAPLLAVVDCEGTHLGQAFDTFCLAPEFDADGEPTGELIDTLCGGVGDGLEWPGDRTVRRAAARICLARFADHFGESYEDSPLVAREFTPTEGIWDRGERRVVCTVDALDDTDGEALQDQGSDG